MEEQARIAVLLRCVAAMSRVETRRDAARDAARLAGADDAIVFVRDEVIGQSLPAAGFPQTLQDSRAWRDLINNAIANGTADSPLKLSGGEAQPAHAIGDKDGTVMVLIGGNPRDDLPVLRSLLPLLGGLFRVEASAARAQAEATVARQSAAQAAELASKLDVTRGELQRAVAVAETAARARDDFLATVSHELRTPLTSVLGWIQLLRTSGDRDDPAYVNECLDTIERNARAQSRLIEDILDFSRIYAGKMRLDVGPVELIDVVKAAIEVVGPSADAKGVRLDRVLDPNAGRVSGDPDRLQQIVWNLLSNAVKFTPRGGKVLMRLERVNSHCEVIVSDTGEGIDPDFLPYVFDRFSQANSSSTRTHSGLGLGLGIVRHLVELHGGTVKAFSPGPGKGSTFIVRFPLMAAHRSATDRTITTGETDHAEPHPTEGFGDLHGVSVLVLEDHADARKLLTTILERAGATVEATDNVPDALELVIIKPFDILLSDIEMPGEDGYSFIQKVRRRENGDARIPAIALTAYARGADRVRALAAGFQMHMSKPVEPEELVAAVKSLVPLHVR